MADFIKILADSTKLAPDTTIKLADNPQIAETFNANVFNADFLAQNFSIGTALNLGNSGITAEKPNNPVYDKPAATLGVLRQVDKISDTFLLAERGILDLRNELAKPPLNGAKSLLERITVYLRNPAHSTKKEREELLPGFFTNLDDAATFKLPDAKPIAKPGGVLEPTPTGSTAPPVLHTDHSALFATGKVMTHEIRQLDTLRHALTTLRRNRQFGLAQRKTALGVIEARLPAEHDKLKNLDASRQEALGDHAVARRVLAEHWAAIEQAWAERRRILENHMGLYYARVRETPLSLTLPDPLDLRYTDADDIVPGCASETTQIPAALTPFLEAVYDVPLADWAGLRELYPLLPERNRIEILVNQRRERLSKRQAMTGGAALLARLLPLHQETLALARDLVKQPFNAGGAVSAVQQQSSKLLALDDLLTGPPHRLRPQAAALHQRLGNAAACLAIRLRGMPPSLRLIWAEAAENDRLPTDAPERWPGLDKAEAADFNAVRTLVELVHWWFRQLHAEASGGARTALRNYLRAAVLHAASDDPGQILRGNVATVPGRFKVGEMLRLTLNQEATPGALLTLMDPDQRVMGTLRVDDYDAQGALAVITQVLDGGGVLPAKTWQVLGKAR
jgi:hypothetical protein